MQIEFYDGLTRFLVESEKTPGKQYLVDLEENVGIGKCDCENFRCTKQAQILGKDKSEAARDAKRCKHILAAREFLGRHLVNALIHQQLTLNKQTQRKETNESQNDQSNDQ